ncbi:hypothetical protein ABZT17_10795 [Streptomyces sp. NPDC005648]
MTSATRAVCGTPEQEKQTMANGGRQDLAAGPCSRRPRARYR